LSLTALGAAVAFLYLLPVAVVYRFYGGSWQTRVAVALFTVLTLAPLALAVLRPAGMTEESSLPELWQLVRAWTGWAFSLLLWVLAVAFASQTMSPARIIQAQVNTQPFALSQPLGVAAFLLASGGVLAGVGGNAIGRPLSRNDVGPLLLAAGLGAMGATFNLAGGDGPALPSAAWFIIKAAALAGAIVVLASRVARATVERRAALAWQVAAPLALLNLLAVLAIVGTRS
jgi:NADH:ubiquinone oxidoreductase subunit H